MAELPENPGPKTEPVAKVSGKYTCVCGSVLNESGRNTHEGTKKHNDYCEKNGLPVTTKAKKPKKEKEVKFKPQLQEEDSEDESSGPVTTMIKSHGPVTLEDIMESQDEIMEVVEYMCSALVKRGLIDKPEQ